MRKNILLFFCLLSLFAFKQDRVIWEVLGSVEYEEQYDEEMDMDLVYPIFGDKIQKLNGKTITISGYALQLEEFKKQPFFILSMNPFSSCYFCGGAGPETVVEVYSKQKIPLQNQRITIKGKLQLNDNNTEHLMYIIKNATVVK